MSEDFSTQSAVELRDRLRAREVSARELTEYSLRSIENHWELGAFVSVNAEEALRQADLADKALREAENPHELPLLTGLPTAHKDLVNAKGFVTTHGSRIAPPTPTDVDDPVVQATRNAGAVTVGKTQVPEFGIAAYSNNLIAPPSRNPLDPNRTSGGSSGGSAAAVAAGMVPAVIGSDAGGSIRIPAAACGLVGLKPGRGVTPADEWRGLVEPWGAPVMGVYGPIARDAQDAALFYDALMQYGDERAQKAVARASEVKGLRIGISYASPFDGFVDVHYSADAKQALNNAAHALEAAGNTVENAEIRYAPYDEKFVTVWAAPLGFAPIPDEAAPLLTDLAQMYRRIAKETTPEQLAEAVAGVIAFADDARQQWAQYDFILTPTMAFAPPAVGAFTAGTPEDDLRLQCEWVPQTSMVNAVGVPAITVPTHTDEAGLSHGAQLIGKDGSEIQLLQLAAQITAHA